MLGRYRPLRRGRERGLSSGERPLHCPQESKESCLPKGWVAFSEGSDWRNLEIEDLGVINPD